MLRGGLDLLRVAGLLIDSVLLTVALIVVATWKPRRGKWVLMGYLLLAATRMFGAVAFVFAVRVVGPETWVIAIYQVAGAAVGTFASVLLLFYVVLARPLPEAQVRYVLTTEPEPRAEASPVPGDGH